MGNWEDVLESLHKQGWSYGYAKCLDAQGCAQVYLVNISRNGERLTMVGPTLEDAVTHLKRLAAHAQLR